ncbi:MAG: hypothetical protein H7175_23815 [Burkholderiales bacterium]|nr:hypothetical protein [Anaerolineae bacterium]
MKLTRRKFLYVLGGILTACGTVNREPDFTIVIHRDTFEPSSLVVPAGSLVAWHNRADSVYTITADLERTQMPQQVVLSSDGLPFDSGNLFPGERWVHTFDTPGTYIYISRFHPFEEMFGAVTVTA